MKNKYKQQLFRQRIKYAQQKISKIIPELEYQDLQKEVFKVSRSGAGGTFRKSDVIRQKKLLQKVTKLEKKLKIKFPKKLQTSIGNTIAGAVFRARASRSPDYKKLYLDLKKKYDKVTGTLNQVNRADFDSSSFVDAWEAEEKGENQTAVDDLFDRANDKLEAHKRAVEGKIKDKEFEKLVTKKKK